MLSLCQHLMRFVLNMDHLKKKKEVSKSVVSGVINFMTVSFSKKKKNPKQRLRDWNSLWSLNFIAL
jgi:hypothetical protein